MEMLSAGLGDIPTALALSAGVGGHVVVKKGESEIVASSTLALNASVSGLGSPRRCGGQGDVLAGATGQT